ncbi:STAS-like domain-containing protein [Pontiella sulfatireligans]|uniref:DUF4325 domain-containing protein n=1 Tax=Pontiella sulfatireligans TaxID=2750658 RepID=A0A6C2UJV8_9BACT|nr:STAS-like domain-containing protein [Pontiella sulfatireligans]VGO20249.1 hypothetical protein SCARR_02310 [Pontiella sulfatireligans]
MEYSIANSFSKYPAGRFKTDGDYSGEHLREIIDPMLKGPEPVIIDITGTEGYGSSFLEEAFGGLVRAGWSLKDLQDKLEIKADDTTEFYKKLIWSYLKEESERCRKGA